MPGTCEQGATENTVTMWKQNQLQCEHDSARCPRRLVTLFKFCAGQTKPTWAVVSITACDLSPQPLTVAPLSFRTGTVALSPPGFNPPTAGLGTLRPATPLTPAAVTWRRSKHHDEERESLEELRVVH